MRIKRFNESVDSVEVIEEYLKNCFIDFIDNGSEVYDHIEFEENFNQSDGDKNWMIIIEMVGYKGKGAPSLKEMVEINKELNEYLLDINSSMEKVRIKCDKPVELEFDYNTIHHNNYNELNSITITYYLEKSERDEEDEGWDDEEDEGWDDEDSI